MSHVTSYKLCLKVSIAHKYYTFYLLCTYGINKNSMWAYIILMCFCGQFTNALEMEKLEGVDGLGRGLWTAKLSLAAQLCQTALQ